MSDTIWSDAVRRLDARPRSPQALQVWADAVQRVFPDEPDLRVHPATFGPFAIDEGWWQLWDRAVVRADDMEAARVAAFRALQRIEAVSPSGEELDEEDYDYDQGMPWELLEPWSLVDVPDDPAHPCPHGPQAWLFGFDLRETYFPWVSVRALEIVVEELRRARPGRVLLQPAPRTVH